MDGNERKPEDAPPLLDGDLDRYEREVILARLERYRADPASVVSSEELDEAILSWDRRDGATSGDGVDALKRSA